MTCVDPVVASRNSKKYYAKLKQDPKRWAEYQAKRKARALKTRMEDPEGYTAKLKRYRQTPQAKAYTEEYCRKNYKKRRAASAAWKAKELRDHPEKVAAYRVLMVKRRREKLDADPQLRIDSNALARKRKLEKMKSDPKFKEKIAAYGVRVRKRRRAMINDIKVSRGGCVFCKEQNPNCLDFHHRDPATKLFTIGNGKLENEIKLLNEIEKCDVVCANCHRKEFPKPAPQGVRYLERKEWLHTIKREQGCKLCIETSPKCLEFHHRDPSTKLFNVSTNTSSSKDRLLKEIAKCDIVCANCHRQLHLSIA